MSNFKTFTNSTSGQPGNAPLIFSGDTNDVLAVVLATGYMNDKASQIKPNDVVWIAHDLLGPPQGILSAFRVVKIVNDWDLLLIISAP